MTGSPRVDSAGDRDGNESVKVGVRVRPLNSRELTMTVRPRSVKDFRHRKADPRNASGWSVTSADTIAQQGVRKPVDGKSLFHFDSVFDETATTEQVHNDMVQPIVDRVLSGENGTVFCYGQTSSGKTFTMYEDSNGGIVQLVASALFHGMEKMSANREFVVCVSYFEIYNEKVRDLLDRNSGETEAASDKKSKSPTSLSPQPSPSTIQSMTSLRTLTIREDPKRGVVSVDCKEKEVQGAAGLVFQLHVGNQNRAVSSTAMNERSSRSHTIFRVTLESREKVGGTSNSRDDGVKDRIDRVSYLHLVDLAGSENGHQSSTGSRQREGGSINQSLLSLSQVIHALSAPPAKRPSYINYRNSKLTHILQPSLAGNARIAVLCCVTPSRHFVEETRSTLKFAVRAKLLTTKPVVNEIADDTALIKKLKQDLEKSQKYAHELENREQLALQSASKAKEEIRKLRSVVCADNELADYQTAILSDFQTTINAPQTAKLVQHSAQLPSPPTKTNNRPPKLANSLLTKTTHAETSDPSSMADDVSQAPNSISSDQAPLSLAAELVPGRSSSSHARINPPTEVIIMRDPEHSAGGSDNREGESISRLRYAEERVEFLKAKLDATEDLVESLFNDVESARSCIHALVFKNVAMANQIETMKSRFKSSTEVKQGEPETFEFLA